MSSIYDWSLTASDNDASDEAINWLEGQLPNTVNDSARAMMMRVAQILGDLGGALAAGGTANALTLTANSPFNTLMDGLIVSFKATASNTAAATINVNTLGTKAIRKQDRGGDVALQANDIRQNGIYHLIYSTAANSGIGAWMLQNAMPTSVERFPAGTRMLFQQSSAPPGWTKVTDNDNAALRVVSGSAGSGGGINFTTAFNAARATTGTVGGTSLTTAQLPAHSHGAGTLSTSYAEAHSHTGTTNADGAHTHPLSTGLGESGVSDRVNRQANTNTGSSTAIGSAGSHTHFFTTNSAGGHSHTVVGSTANAGSGQTHTHSFSGLVNLDVKYVDVIIAVKD